MFLSCCLECNIQTSRNLAHHWVTAITTGEVVPVSSGTSIIETKSVLAGDVERPDLKFGTGAERWGWHCAFERGNLGAGYGEYAADSLCGAVVVGKDGLDA